MLQLSTKKLIKNWSESLLVVFHSSLLVFCSFCFIQACRDRASLLLICAFVVWIIACATQIIVHWRKAITIESEEVDNIQEKSSFFTELRSQDLAEWITVFILYIPFVAIWIVILTSDDLSTPITVDPDFEPLGIGSSILLAIGLIIQDLDKLFEIKQQAIKKILLLVSAATTFSAFIIWTRYMLHFTEVTS